MESVSNIRILGLRALDQHEMRDSIPNADLTFEPQVPAERGATSHEPATVVAVVLISAAALNGLAAWLLKKRHRKDVTIEVEKKRGDGSSERVAVTCICRRVAPRLMSCAQSASGSGSTNR